MTSWPALRSQFVRAIDKKCGDALADHRVSAVQQRREDQEPFGRDLVNSNLYRRRWVAGEDATDVIAHGEGVDRRDRIDVDCNGQRPKIVLYQPGKIAAVQDF